MIDYACTVVFCFRRSHADGPADSLSGQRREDRGIAGNHVGLTGTSSYGGTPGYGRAYRERLRGQWGGVDVEDCAAVAQALVDEGTAAAGRVAIRGSSAGGFTAALSVAAGGLYACAALFYPVVDPVSLAAGGAHDFESHYLDALIGPKDRHADRIRAQSTVRG
ncbi:prolyl oligopeptidase family serine peptidase [Streptomyces sp. GbtcB6]|uniref:prolyl oligopeptidase family serine peptidase n=1 Tax=Streptomyces sp. GbtcB6 TaxID=2824751 RepID=UPI0027E5513F|nr:prolyl oligopeptidase family serine peptidase [Streptomyces sp. GbtcB6]